MADDDDCLIWPFSRNSRGYGKLYLDGKLQYCHRVVCEARHGPPPSAQHQAAHSCGKGHEACVNPRHLRWATPAENCADQVGHGTHNRGERHPMARLTRDAVAAIRVDDRPADEIARDHGVSKQHIQSIKSGQSWSALGA